MHRLYPKFLNVFVQKRKLQKVAINVYHLGVGIITVQVPWVW